MWIEKIELTNFKVYQYQRFEFPKPEQGRNLVLIGGINGFGKTTLLEALYLCLYGEDATHYLARAGLKRNSYAKFLQNALHGRDQMRVAVRLMTKVGYGFEITRTWFFDSKGELYEQEVRLDEIRDGISTPLDKENLAFVLEDHVVPANLAPFFFFDGEEVKKLADQDRTSWIKQGMESLMGVVLVKALRDRLLQYQNNRRTNGGHNVDKTKLDAMLNALNQKIEQQTQLANDLYICNEEIARNQIRRDEVQRELISLGAGGGNIKSIEDILREEGEKKHDLDDCRKQLENLLADRLPFHLVSDNLMQSIKARLSEERIRLDWDAQKQGLEPQKNKFITALFNTQPMLKLTDSKKSVLESWLKPCVEQAWESLYFPRPTHCATELLHDYLELRQRQRLEESLSTTQLGANQIRTLIKQRSDLKDRLEKLKMRRIKLESVNDDGALEKLNHNLTTVQDELEQQNKHLGDLERQATALDANIENERSAYERENAHYISAEPTKSIANKAQKVIRLIDELLPRLFELKTQELSQAVTRHYKQLAHKKQVNNIVIEADGSCHLFTKGGKEIKFDRSAGENQIFATALYAGLAEASGYDIPLVVDTPLARLSSEHRKNLLNYWCSNSDRQVILLSQDTEVGKELMESVRPHLSKTYLLESSLISDDVYKTVAKANAYFGEQA